MRKTECLTGWCAVLILLAGIAGCGAGEKSIHEYQIVITGSITPEPVEFTGSYTYENDDKLMTRDLSGSGSFSTTFQGKYLQQVRVQRALGEGLVSLSVYQDGEAIFESPSSSSNSMIIFTNEEK